MAEPTLLGIIDSYGKDWTPDNFKICQRGQANFRMLIETVLSMLTNLYDFKRMRHRAWEYFETKVGFTIHGLVQHLSSVVGITIG